MEIGRGHRVGYSRQIDCLPAQNWFDSGRQANELRCFDSDENRYDHRAGAERLKQLRAELVALVVQIANATLPGGADDGDHNGTGAKVPVDLVGETAARLDVARVHKHALDMERRAQTCRKPPRRLSILTSV